MTDPIPFDWCFYYFSFSNYIAVAFCFGRIIRDYDGNWHFQVRSFRVRPVIWYQVSSFKTWVEALVSCSRVLDY